MALHRSAQYDLVKHFCRHDGRAGAGCHAGHEGMIRAQVKYPAGRGGSLGQPLDQAPAVRATVRESYERLPAQIGRTADRRSALRGDQHQLLTKGRERGKAALVEGLRDEGSLDLKSLEQAE